MLPLCHAAIRAMLSRAALIAMLTPQCAFITLRRFRCFDATPPLIFADYAF